MDADVISVHIVFAEFYRQIQPELRFRQHPVSFWPRLLHRKLYYRFIISLERRIYSRMDTSDRKSTRLNSSHGYISYAVFCLKKKKKKHDSNRTSNKRSSTIDQNAETSY